jgi:hypothetical protein
MRALVLVAAVLLSPTPAIACQCGTPSLAAAAQHADVAFVGTITRVTATKTSVTYEVAVEGVWKGKVPASARVTTVAGDCPLVALDPEIRRWVFFTDQTFSLGMCGGGTRPATTATVAAMTKLRGAPRSP